MRDRILTPGEASREWERMRDYGHTWGEGIDDGIEPTEEEMDEHAKRIKAYEAELDALRIVPSDFAKEIKKMYDALPELTPGDSDFYKKRELILKRKYECIESIGRYHNVTFEIGNSPYGNNLDKGTFAISYANHAANRAEYPCVLNMSKDALLKLAADLDLITYYTVHYRKENGELKYISNVDNARLQKEFQKWGVPREQEKVTESSVLNLEYVKALAQKKYLFEKGMLDSGFEAYLEDVQREIDIKGYNLVVAQMKDELSRSERNTEQEQERFCASIPK